ncbi:unnamed protein product, partial [Meganyctiphanes norvegica]
MALRSLRSRRKLTKTLTKPRATISSVLRFCQHIKAQCGGDKYQLNPTKFSILLFYIKTQILLKNFEKFFGRSGNPEYNEIFKKAFRKWLVEARRVDEEKRKRVANLSERFTRTWHTSLSNDNRGVSSSSLSSLGRLRRRPGRTILTMGLKMPGNAYVLSRPCRLETETDAYMMFGSRSPSKNSYFYAVHLADQKQNSYIIVNEFYNESRVFKQFLCDRHTTSWHLRAGTLNHNYTRMKNTKSRGLISIGVVLANESYLFQEHVDEEGGPPMAPTILNWCPDADQGQFIHCFIARHSSQKYYCLTIFDAKIKIGRKQISKLATYSELDIPKITNLSAESSPDATEPQLDDALKKSEQRETDSNKSLDESIPENEFDISPGSGKRVVRKGRPDTCTPLRRPKAQEGLKYVSETQLKAEPELNLGGTVEFTPTFSSTSKFPILDDLDGSKSQNNGETRSPSRIPHISYDLNQLLHLGTSPLAKQAPLNISKIMGITVKNFKKDDYGKKIEIIESRNPEKIGDTPNISDCVSLGTNSSTVGNLTKLLANVVEVKDLPDDIWVDYNCNNMQYEKVHKEIVAQTEDELKVEEQNCHLNDNIIKYDEEQCSNGLLQEKEITEKRLSMPKSCGDSEFEKECDQQKVNNHSVSFLQRGLFARLKFKMALPKENSLNKPVGVAQLKK